MARNAITKKRVVNKRRSERQRARILDLLEDEPMTANVLAEKLHLKRNAVAVHILALRKYPRKVRRCGFEMTISRPREVYGLGRDPDLTYEEWQDARVLGHLALMSSIYGLAERMGVDYESAKKYVRRLRENEKIYVAGWVWNANMPMALYKVGNKPNVPRPRSKAAPRQTAKFEPAAWAAALGL